jgi:hypothetical protein
VRRQSDAMVKVDTARQIERGDKKVKNIAIRTIGAVLLVAALLAVGGPVAAKHFAPWGNPSKLGPTINFDNSWETCPTFAKGGLAFYYASNATGSHGNRDIYMVRRASLDARWGDPVQLNDNVNTAMDERCPYATPDGRRIIFVRQEATGDNFYMSTLRGPKDDLNWGEPVKLEILGSPSTDYALTGFENEDGTLTLYFGSMRSGAGDIYQTTMDRQGNFTQPVPVPELNDPAAWDVEPTVTKDGLELYLTSTRGGGLGGADIWVATRDNTSEPWGKPVNLGAPVNTSFMEMRGAISWQGDTVIFSSTRSGMWDLYQSIRLKITGRDK